MEIKGLILYRQAERPSCTCTESAENTRHTDRQKTHGTQDRQKHEGHKTGRKYSKHKTGRKHRDTRQVKSSENTDRHMDTDR